MSLTKLFAYCWLCIASCVSAHPGQHEQLARINRVIEQQPEKQALYMQRGMIHSTGGAYDHALADYGLAEKLGPPVLVAYDLGVLHYRMGDLERASAYLDQYLMQFPASAAAYDYRARVARDSGHFDLAVSNLEMYFKVHASPHPGNYLSAAAMLRDMGQIDRALATLDHGLGKLGMVPQLQRQAITLELERGQAGTAVARLETLRVPLQESPGWQLQMAELLLLVDRRQEAANLLLAAQTELAAQRPTPARRQMQYKAQEMQRLMEAEQPPH
jgi:tetratricopeptide (TPR) repeat protein